MINEKWDTCLERTVINFGIGLVSAGVAGVVLTRENTVIPTLDFFISHAIDCPVFTSGNYPWPKQLF